MFYGTVVKYVADKHFGFIRSDNGQDVFFHDSVVEANDDIPEIAVDQAVKYELAPRTEEERDKIRDGEKPKNREAKRVQLIEKLPGGISPFDDQERARRHPKARKKKPNWRR